jgi:hypothetical protein
MSTVNNSSSLNFQTMLEEMAQISLAELVQDSTQKKASQASLAQLMKTVQDALKDTASSTTGSSSSIGVTPSDSNGTPTNAQMQEMMGILMETLTQLEGDIAKYGNKNALANSSVGQSLSTVMQAQVKHSIKELHKHYKETIKEGQDAKNAKDASIALGVILAVVAVLCCQPELAVVAIAFTTLSATGEMTKMTNGLSDGIKKGLTKVFGTDPKTAGPLSKVIADVVIIAAAMIITAATCGAGAAMLADTATEIVATSATEEAGIEMTDLAATDTTETTTETTDAAKTSKNPFSNLPKWANVAMVAGSSATAATNFGSNLVAAILVNSKESAAKKREAELIYGTLIDLVAALPGIFAGAAVASGPGLYQLNNVGSLVKISTTLAAATGLAQAGEETKSGMVYSQLATLTKEQGQTQSLITELNGLNNMNSAQLTADTKALGSKMKTWSTEIATLGQTMNLTGASLAQVLQA